MLGFLGLLPLKRDYREIAALQAVYSIAGSMHLAENVRSFHESMALQETARFCKKLSVPTVWPCSKCLALAKVCRLKKPGSSQGVSVWQ